MEYLVKPLFTNNQSMPGVVAGQGYRVMAGNGIVLAPCLGVDSKGYLVTRNPSEDHALEFRLEALAGDALGYFRLVHLATGKVVDVEGKSTSAGARFHLWDWHGGENQQFEVCYGGKGMAQLVARNSKMVLMIENASTAAGAKIVQGPWTGGGHQRWIFTPTFDASDRTCSVKVW